jgi:hypothetical protein
LYQFSGIKFQKKFTYSAVSFQRSAFSFPSPASACGEENFARQGIVLMGTGPEAAGKS